MKRDLKISLIIILLAALGVGLIFFPHSEAKTTELSILNTANISENGTVYVKLTDKDNTSLTNKTVHVVLKNDKGEVVYNQSVTTHLTGVAIAKLDNVPPGEYTMEISFDGDSNYTSSNFSKKITVGGNVTDEGLENNPVVQDTVSDSSSSSSYTPSQSTPSYTYTDDSSDANLPEYDEDGNPV